MPAIFPSGKPSRRWLWNGSTGCFQSGLHCVSYASYDYHGASSRCNCFWFYATDVPHASWRWVHTESEHPEIKGLWGSTVTWTSLPGWFAAPSKGIWISAFHPVPSSVWLHWQAAARSISVCPRCRATGWTDKSTECVAATGGMCRQGCEPISILCLHYEWGKPELMQLHGGYLHDDHPHGRPKTKHLVHWQGRIFGATWIGHAPRLPQWFFGLAEFGHPGVAIWCPHRKCNDAERLATFDPKRVESRWHFARGWVQNCHPEGQGTSPKSKIWMNQPIGLMDLVGGWPTPEKNVKVSWDDDIPNIWEKTCSKPPVSFRTRVSCPVMGIVFHWVYHIKTPALEENAAGNEMVFWHFVPTPAHTRDEASCSQVKFQQFHRMIQPQEAMPEYSYSFCLGWANDLAMTWVKRWSCLWQLRQLSHWAIDVLCSWQHMTASNCVVAMHRLCLGT